MNQGQTICDTLKYRKLSSIIMKKFVMSHYCARPWLWEFKHVIAFVRISLIVMLARFGSMYHVGYDKLN